MQKLFVYILAILRHMRPGSKASPAPAGPGPYRSRQVGRAPEPKVYLKVLAPAGLTWSLSTTSSSSRPRLPLTIIR